MGAFTSQKAPSYDVTVLACELVAARIGAQGDPHNVISTDAKEEWKNLPAEWGLAAGAAVNGIGVCFPVFLEGPVAMRVVAGTLNRWRQFV